NPQERRGSGLLDSSNAALSNMLNQAKQQTVTDDGSDEDDWDYLSVSLPQAEPEGSPMRTVLPHSQSGIPDPYSSVLQEALDSLHPT
ncbi:hypothetical protein B484DRAFT_409449, partial [Ochromonadaceae sp. CCMP2298]